MVEKEVPEKSFFNFFKSFDATPEKMDELEDDEAEELDEKINNDMIISENLEDEVISFSLEYYLGIV